MVTPGRTQVARRLRRDATEAEKRLWRALRARQLDGLKFRRQYPIGPYVADFACLERMLVVEADGGQHTPEGDAARTAFIEGCGWLVLRFSNRDILSDLDGVVLAVRRAGAP